jgi:RNA polymerase sigma factor (sigma-70 family)
MYRRAPVLTADTSRIPAADTARLPEFEPGLPGALSGLSERQRVAVMLVHCFEWSLGEVAEHLGVSKGTVQKHLDRGMVSLRRELGVE